MRGGPLLPLHPDELGSMAHVKRCDIFYPLVGPSTDFVSYGHQDNLTRQVPSPHFLCGNTEARAHIAATGRAEIISREVKFKLPHLVKSFPLHFAASGSEC